MSKDKFLATLRLLLCIVLCMIIGALMVWFLTLTGLAEHAGTAVAFIRSFPAHLKDIAEVMTGALCMALVGGMMWEMAVHWRDLLALLDGLFAMVGALVRIFDLVSDDPGEIFDEKEGKPKEGKPKDTKKDRKPPEIDLCADIDELADTILTREAS